MRNSAYMQVRDNLVKSAKAKKRSLIGHYELTARCNFDCKMCYVHTQDNSAVLSKELSTEQWKRIFDEAYECDLLYATLSGGECLIRNDFKELYLHLWNKRVQITVISNGALINDEYIDFFIKYQPCMIQISIYGSDDDGYTRVTGHKGFNRVISAVDKLEAAGIDVRVVTTPSKYMGDDLINILRLCRDKKLYYSEANMYLMKNRDNSQKDDYFLSDDEILDLSIKQAELFRTLTPVESLPDLFGPMNCEPTAGLSCNAGSCTAFVSWDGKMYPCVAIMDNGVDVLKLGYAEAWRQTVENTNKIVNAIECQGCPYDDACPKCPAFRLKDFHSGHCDTNLCNLTRRLVAAGVSKIKNV